MATIGLCDGGNGILSHNAITLTNLPAWPGGASEGQRWEESASAVGWSDDCTPGVTERVSRLTMGEDMGHGGDFTARKHHYGEVSVAPFNPHQHMRTRSLSVFHGSNYK